jgi:hypothetical protein
LGEPALPDDVLTVAALPAAGGGKADYASVRRVAMQRLGIGKAA